MRNFPASNENFHLQFLRKYKLLDFVGKFFTLLSVNKDRARKFMLDFNFPSKNINLMYRLHLNFKLFSKGVNCIRLRGEGRRYLYRFLMGVVSCSFFVSILKLGLRIIVFFILHFPSLFQHFRFLALNLFS